MTTRNLPGPAGSPHLTPKLAFRIAAFGLVILAALGVLILRLWFVQVIGGADYEARATDNRVRTVMTEAPRGIITDRNGAEIVRNRAGENVVARPQELPAAHRERVLRTLAQILRTTPAALGAKLARAQGAPFQSVVLAEDVPPLVQAVIEERRRQLPGIALERAYVREYPHGSLAAHLVGYTTPIPAEEAAAYRRKGYRPDEKVGRYGVERSYEDYLRGAAGEVRYEVDAMGELTARGVISARPPRPGRNVQLTIDLRTQKVLEEELRARVALSGSSPAAAGVALDPDTGEVLALASYPTFRPSVFAEGSDREKVRLLRDPAQPFFDRAIAGGYPAASTFKAVTAVAALEGGYTTADEAIPSPGSIRLYNQEFINFGRRDLGVLTLRTALMYSSDTYFDQVADRFYRDGGNTPLQDWARRFGFGARTGIDLPGEEPGLVPTPEWKRRQFAGQPGMQIWYPGDTIQMAIGQKDLQVTPLQVAVAYAAIANGGRVVTPTVVRRIQELDGRTALEPIRTRRPRPLGARPETLRVVRDGLYLAANDYNGTSAAVFAGLPDEVKVAGKTGTAENPHGADHSWFVGYAPYHHPRIVAAIVVEQGGQGANAAAPAVCRVIAAYLRFDGSACGSGARPN